MRNFRDPDPISGRGGTLAALGAVTVPLLVVLLLAEPARSWRAMAEVSNVVTYVAGLFSIALLYLYWRTNGGPIGWLLIGLTAVTIQALAMAGMVVVDPDLAESHQGWIALCQAAVALGVVSLVILSERHEVRVDPVVAGAVVGLATVGVRYALVTTTPAIELSTGAIGGMRIVVLVVDLAITVALFRLTVAPGWVRIRLAGAWTLLSIAHIATYPAPDNDLLSGVTVLANILGATILLALSLALLRRSMLDNREELRQARLELEQVQADVRDDAARLHEIRATIAGLTSASQLIHQSEGLSDGRRRQIEAMTDSEMGRLQRLLHDEHVDDHVPIDLDTVIEPLVLRHQLRGFPVRWRPSGERVVAQSDDVAEVLNVLLENAFQHAQGAGAWIYTRHLDDVVEIAVADSGPGVDRSVRSRIFEWGERSNASSGSGIGLNVAQQLTVDLGGYLRLVDSPALGATFVFGLPAEEPQ